MKDNKFSKKDIQFLYDGLIAFYPIYFYPPDEASVRPVFESYEGIPRRSFVSYTTWATGTNDVEEAIVVLRFWLDAEDFDLAETIPPNLQQLIADLEEYEKTLQKENEQSFKDRFKKETAKVYEDPEVEAKIPRPQEVRQPVITEVETGKKEEEIAYEPLEPSPFYLQVDNPGPPLGDPDIGKLREEALQLGEKGFIAKYQPTGRISAGPKIALEVASKRALASLLDGLFNLDQPVRNALSVLVSGQGSFRVVSDPETPDAIALKPVPEKVPEIHPVYVQPKTGRVATDQQLETAVSKSSLKQVEQLRHAAALSLTAARDRLTEKIISQASAETIRQAGGQEAFQNMARILADDFFTKIVHGKPETAVDPAVFSAIADPNAIADIVTDPKLRREVAKAALIQSILLSGDNVIARLILGGVIQPDTLDYLYTLPSEKEYVVSAQPTSFPAYQVRPNALIEEQRERDQTALGDSINRGDYDLAYSLAKRGLGVLSDKYGAQVRANFLSRFFANIIVGSSTAAGAVSGYPMLAVGQKLAQHYRSLLPLLASGQADFFALSSGLPVTSAIVSSGAITASANASISAAFTPLFAFSTGEKIYGVAVASPKALSLVTGQLTKEGALLIGTATKAGAQAFTVVSSQAIGRVAGFLAGFAETTAAIAAALGTTVPIVGNVIFALIGWIIGKIVEFIPKFVSWIKQHANEILAIPALLMIFGGLALGGLFGNVLVGTGTLAGLGWLSAKAGGVSGMSASVGGFFNLVIDGITDVIGPSIGPSVLGVVLVFPVVVALIMFIINSGAYLVPPGSTSTSGFQESLYMDLTKTASPPGPFENPNSGESIAVDYTITLKSKKGTLTDFGFINNCSVIKEDNIPNCAHPIPDIGDIPNQLLPGESYTFTYSDSYDDNFTDSFVVDTFTVTATVDGSISDTVATSASVKIGDPPEQCPFQRYPTSSGYLTQGAYTVGTCNGKTCSHSAMEALDVGVVGVPVYATHNGTAAVKYDSCIGNHVEITSTCEGLGFFSQYAHMSAVTANDGSQIAAGQIIGYSGNTGTCTTGSHLHYRFKYTSGANPSYPSNPPYMWTTYFPQDVPRGCGSDQNPCGISW